VVYVSQSVTRARYTETAERIDVYFGAETAGDHRNTLSDGGPDPPWRGERKNSMQPLPNYFGHLLYAAIRNNGASYRSVEVSEQRRRVFSVGSCQYDKSSKTQRATDSLADTGY